MQQSGEHHIAADRETVWRALNDPDVLARCIDGCESMERAGDAAFTARIKARVGPVNARFDAELTLTEVDPPAGYTLNGNVKGGAAGFARGRADVRLEEAGDGTRLCYEVHGNVGGKLAQVGSRLIDGAARKMADDFFACLRDTVAPATAAQDTTAKDPAAHNPAANDTAVPRFETGGRLTVWIVVFAALLIAMAVVL